MLFLLQPNSMFVAVQCVPSFIHHFCYYYFLHATPISGGTPSSNSSRNDEKSTAAAKSCCERRREKPATHCANGPSSPKSSELLQKSGRDMGELRPCALQLISLAPCLRRPGSVSHLLACFSDEPPVKQAQTPIPARQAVGLRGEADSSNRGKHRSHRTARRWAFRAPQR